MLVFSGAAKSSFLKPPGHRFNEYVIDGEEYFVQVNYECLAELLSTAPSESLST